MGMPESSERKPVLVAQASARQSRLPRLEASAMNAKEMPAAMLPWKESPVRTPGPVFMPAVGQG